MTIEEVNTLISGGESERVEMTRAFDKADKIGQAICAFANDLSDSSQAGILLLGVDNGGKVSGGRITDRQMASLGGLKSDGNLFPPPSMSVEKLALPEGDVVVLTVFPSRYPPIKYNGQVWIRIGPRKALASEDDIHLLVERRSRYGIRDEELPCDRATINDLDLSLFSSMYLPRAVDAQVIEADDRPVLEQLSALRFFNQEKNCPTNLGVLLFARHPDRFIPSAYIQYVRFAGKDNAGDILQEIAFRGPLVKTVQELDVFVKTGPGAVRPVPVSALREEPASRYPSWALRELVLNAIIHRDYFLGNAPIKFYEYKKDRIEISNPGGLFGRVKPDNFPFVNDYRNPLLAEAMKVLGFVNKYNRGIAKVNRELEANGNPHAQFDINKKTEFRVTVIANLESGTINQRSGMMNSESGTINQRSGAMNSENGTINQRSGTMNSENGTINQRSGTIKYDIQAQEEIVMKAIESSPGIKRDGIFLSVRTSLRTVSRILKRLSAAGKIEYRGSRRTGGWYVRT